MKKVLLFIFIFLALNMQAQKSSEILPVLNVDSGIMPSNFVYIIDGTNYWGKTSASNLTFLKSQISDFPSIPAQVNLIAGNRISITGTYPNITISYIEPTINIISSKTLNSNFTVSTTKQALVSYTLTCSATNPLVAGNSSANVFLEYSTNGGTTWLLPNQAGNQQSVALAVAVAITNNQTASVSGVIPANALVRIRTTTSGTATVTYLTGTEVY